MHSKIINTKQMGPSFVLTWCSGLLDQTKLSSIQSHQSSPTVNAQFQFTNLHSDKISAYENKLATHRTSLKPDITTRTNLTIQCLLYLLWGSQQDISTGQVSVDEVPGLEVTHSVGNLYSILTQCGYQDGRLLPPQTLQQRTSWRQLRHLQT